MTSHRDPLANLDLPGVFRCLARDGHLDPAAPAARELALRFAGPDALLFRSVGERIDQIGWPVGPRPRGPASSPSRASPSITSSPSSSPGPRGPSSPVSPSIASRSPACAPASTCSR